MGCRKCENYGMVNEQKGKKDETVTIYIPDRIIHLIPRLIVIALAIYAGVHILNIEFPLLNPPQDYVTNKMPVVAYVQPKTRAEAPDIVVYLSLDVKGTLVAGEKARLTGRAEFFDGAKDVKNITVGFQQGLQWMNGDDKVNVLINAPPRSGAVVFTRDQPWNLFPQKYPDGFTDTIYDKEVYWSIEGDYYVVAFLGLKNGTQIYTEIPSASIHVEPRSFREQEKFSAVNQSLTVVLTVFAIIEGWNLMKSRGERQEQDQSSSTAATTKRDTPAKKP